MIEHNPPTAAQSACRPVSPLPIALYVSGELIYELYEGGQPERKFSICWERLIPVEQREPNTVPQNPQTTFPTRQEQTHLD
jgi:hypothetical protein